MRIPQSGWTEVIFPRPDQALCSGRGGKIEVAYTRCINCREPKAFEIWAFTEDGIHEVHPFAGFQISDDFTEDTFYSHFFNARQIQIPLLGRRSVNENVRWLDVPHPFGENGSRVATWTENTFIYSWGPYPTVIPNRPIRRRAIENVPVNPHNLACQANHKLLRRICVDRRHGIERELHARILQDIRDGFDASLYEGRLK